MASVHPAADYVGQENVIKNVTAPVAAPQPVRATEVAAQPESAERAGYDRDALFVGGSELSFEERRAMLWPSGCPHYRKRRSAALLPERPRHAQRQVHVAQPVAPQTVPAVSAPASAPETTVANTAPAPASTARAPLAPRSAPETRLTNTAPPASAARAPLAPRQAPETPLANTASVRVPLASQPIPQPQPAHVQAVQPGHARPPRPPHAQSQFVQQAFVSPAPARAPHYAQPSPTINTQAAMNTVNGWFTGDIDSRPSQSPYGNSSPFVARPSPSPAPAVPVPKASKPAFEIFSDAAPHAHAPPKQAPPAFRDENEDPSGLSRPTMRAPLALAQRDARALQPAIGYALSSTVDMHDPANYFEVSDEEDVEDPFGEDEDLLGAVAPPVFLKEEEPFEVFVDPSAAYVAGPPPAIVARGAPLYDADGTDDFGISALRLDRPLSPLTAPAESASAPPRATNPFEPSETARFLGMLGPLSNRLAGVDERLKECAPAIRPASILSLGGHQFAVEKECGSGAFARIYLARSAESDEASFALKVQRPPCPWEYYAIRELRQRLSDARVESRMMDSYVDAQGLVLYKDASVIVMDEHDQGSLLDVVNAYARSGKSMDETLVMFYTIEILRMVEHMHMCGMLHGDVKPDNLLVRSDESESLSNTWSRTGEGGWAGVGLVFVDFGRAVDLALYPEGTVFSGSSDTESFQCIEMQEGRKWLYEADTYGILGCVHCMLHNKYMAVVRDEATGRWRVAERFKRYWQVGLWERLFDTLLNSNSPTEFPPLKELRGAFEDYLEQNAYKAKTIKSLLCKQDIMMYEAR